MSMDDLAECSDTEKPPSFQFPAAPNPPSVFHGLASSIYPQLDLDLAYPKPSPQDPPCYPKTMLAMEKHQ